MYSDSIKRLDENVDPDWIDEPVKCEWCSHTDMIIGMASKNRGLTVDLRFDNEDYNQLDLIVCQGGGFVMDASIDIKFCPFCGRRL